MGCQGYTIDTVVCGYRFLAAIKPAYWCRRQPPVAGSMRKPGCSDAELNFAVLIAVGPYHEHHRLNGRSCCLRCRSAAITLRPCFARINTPAIESTPFIAGMAAAQPELATPQVEQPADDVSRPRPPQPSNPPVTAATFAKSINPVLEYIANGTPPVVDPPFLGLLGPYGPLPKLKVRD